MIGARSIALFLAAALAEIGGAYLVWIGLRRGEGAEAVFAGVAALGVYGYLVAQQSSGEFGRVLAAYGGVFVVGSLLWGVAFDRFRPDGFDLGGAAICLLGVATIMYAPR
ncbi:MAG: YnfA family protein [Thermoleophilia bacterium]